MIVAFRPLQVWRHPETPARRSSPFRAGWTNTLNVLTREVRMLDGDNVILGAFLREQDLRQDGMPKAGARDPFHPGVEVSFDSVHGRLVYATDVHRDYEANVRAIALALEALRAVDRYGVSSRGEQYAGWKALASGPGDNLPDTVDKAWGFLERILGEQIVAARRDDLQGLLRMVAKKTHPDLGGDYSSFRQYEAARRILLGAA